MATIIKIDTRSKMAQRFLEYVKTLPFVQIEQQPEKSSYDPDFVKKIKRAQKQDGTIIDTKDIWGSLGLK
jgi:hypothetical protein